MTSNLGMWAVGCAAIGLAFASPAHAGCGDDITSSFQPSAYMPSGHGAGRVQLAAAVYDSSIVGMWSVKFVSGGKTIDFGYAVWHADGTEFMNSGGRAPATQNFCLGVWEQTGPSSYKLKHLALSYDNTGTLNADVVIGETVTVAANGGSFTGPFTIDVYAPNTTTVLQHVAGTITGTRVTVD